MSSHIDFIIEMSVCWYYSPNELSASHIVFIIEMFVCWYDSLYELSYCLNQWNVCLLIWFTLWALILTLSLKCLSVDIIHPMSSQPLILSLLLKCLFVDMIHPMSFHIVFIIEMYVC